MIAEMLSHAFDKFLISFKTYYSPQPGLIIGRKGQFRGSTDTYPIAFKDSGSLLEASKLSHFMAPKRMLNLLVDCICRCHLSLTAFQKHLVDLLPIIAWSSAP